MQAIRKRYLASKKNNRAGSVERRKVALGGLVSVSLKNGQSSEERVLSTLKEPRGIDFHKGQLAISSENKAYVLTDTIHTIQNDWFSYIHTVEFSPFKEENYLFHPLDMIVFLSITGSKILVNGSGLLGKMVFIKVKTHKPTHHCI